MKHVKNYLSILSMLVALMLLTIASCTPDKEKEEDLICKVSVESGEGGIGVVSNYEVMSGDEVTLKAVPEATYRFVNWTVGGKEVSKENPYTTTITATTQFKANFEKDNYKVTVIASEGGTATVSKTQVAPGEKVTFTATPAEGYSFINWTVNGEEVSTEKTYTTNIIKDIEIKANFITHKVTVTSGEGGMATASKMQVGYNGQVTLTATSNPYYEFVNWTVNGVEVSKENPYTATITEDIEIKANFREIYKFAGTENGYAYVDLGLSVKWATCNVGADSPEEYGDYFSWGETTPKTTYNWSTYKYCNGSNTTMTKYCTDSYYGIVDNKTTLELSDDAAYVNWGGNWRMPTKAEQRELRNADNCTWTWTTLNGVNGYKVISKINGNSIFLPAAGYRYYDNLNKAGGCGTYWSSSLSLNYSYIAYDLYFYSIYGDWYNLERYNGQSVRAVCD